MDLSSTATELCSNVFWQSLWVTAGNIYIQILICLEFIEHIIDRNLNTTIFFVDNLSGKLDFVDEKIELPIFLSRNKVLDIFTKRDWISELIVTSLVQFDFYDVVFLNFLREKVFIEQIKQQYRFSAAADTGNDFDLAVPHMMNHTIQIIISFNHYNYLVLATIASLLSCIVYHEFLKLSIALQKVHNKVTTFTS